MAESNRSALADLVEALTDIARTVIEEDGHHVAMYFLGHAGDGGVESCVFEEEDDPSASVGSARARQMADAVRSSGAEAVVIVSEAWSAKLDEVPPEGRVREASAPQDVLLVAGIDRSGETLALETAVFHEANGAVRLGPTRPGGEGYQVNVFDEVRAVWALTRP